MTLSYYLALSAILFAIGLFGALARRNVITVLMSLEVMLCAADINIAAFGRFLHSNSSASAIIMLFVSVTAAQIALAMALIAAVYKNYKSVFTGDYNTKD